MEGPTPVSALIHAATMVKSSHMLSRGGAPDNNETFRYMLESPEINRFTSTGGAKQAPPSLDTCKNILLSSSLLGHGPRALVLGPRPHAPEGDLGRRPHAPRRSQGDKDNQQETQSRGSSETVRETTFNFIYYDCVKPSHKISLNTPFLI
jgi:hypothetical protein